MAQLREGSVIKKKTGDEIIATLADTLEIREMDSLLFSTLFAGVPVSREELDFIENENPFLLEVAFSPSSGGMFFGYWDGSGENLTIASFNREISGLKLFLPKDGSEGTSSKIPGNNDLLAMMIGIINNRVKTDVPEGAKFTDTVYMHPATHSADMITDGTTNKVYTSAEKTKLSGIAANANNYSHPTSDGSKHVPANGTTNNGKVLKAGATAGTYVWSNDNDTITTINGKTGAITKADIVALGIPAQDTTYSIATTSANGLMSSTDKQNLNASTTSRHTHSNQSVIDKFSEVGNKPYYDGTEIGGGSIVDLGKFTSNTNLFTHIATNQLPTGQYTFTLDSSPTFLLLKDFSGMYVGTYYGIQMTVYNFIISTSGEILASKEIILMDQMPVSGGVLENYREKLTTVSANGGSINLSLGNVFTHTPSGNMTYSITNAVNGQAHSFTLIVNMGSTVRTITFPSSVKWQGGEIPDMSTANKTYILTFMTVNGGTTWLGMFGGEF